MWYQSSSGSWLLLSAHIEQDDLRSGEYIGIHQDFYPYYIGSVDDNYPYPSPSRPTCSTSEASYGQSFSLNSAWVPTNCSSNAINHLASSSPMVTYREQPMALPSNTLGLNNLSAKTFTMKQPNQGILTSNSFETFSQPLRQLSRQQSCSNGGTAILDRSIFSPAAVSPFEFKLDLSALSRENRRFGKGKLKRLSEDFSPSTK